MIDPKSRSYIDSIGLLFIRVMVGVVFVFHGSQKVFGAFGGKGMSGFTEGLKSMGFPMPEVNAWLAAGSELIGGALLIVGFFTRLAAIPPLIAMLVAAFVVHRSAFALPTGMEYALTLACVLVGIALLGPGRFSVDAILGKRKSVE